MNRVPREETVLYHHRDLYELKLDNFIQDEFVFENDGDKFDLGPSDNEDSDTFAEQKVRISSKHPALC